MDRELLSRQPICHADLSIFAYELLFRDSEADKASIRDEDEATAQVVVNTLMEIGLHQMVGNQLAFINVSRNFLLSDLCEALPPERVVLELLDPIEIDSALDKRVHQLIGMGYQIGVGEFVFRSKFESLLERAHIVKFDLLANYGLFSSHVDTVSKYRAKRSAERVESPQQFNMCKSYGFDYFQGYFFCRPEIRSVQEAAAQQADYLAIDRKIERP
jgi:EAL and modified HD-GYP domain-containing signal transduction protein